MRRKFFSLSAAYGLVAAGVSAVDTSHLYPDLLSISLGVTETAHMFIIISGPVHSDPALGPQECYAATVAFEYV